MKRILLILMLLSTLFIVGCVNTKVECNNIIGKVIDFENYQSRPSGVTAEVTLDDGNKIIIFQGYRHYANIGELQIGKEVVYCDNIYAIKPTQEKGGSRD